MERYINLEGTYNFRDIGGYATLDGRKVAYGKLYRSDELSKLSEQDINTIQDLGIKTIIDYRGEKERINNEDVMIPGTTLYYLDPKADVAALASSELSGSEKVLGDPSLLTADIARKLMTQQNIEFVTNPESIKAFRKMFDIILDAENIATVQHCRGGKDRTGYGVALILLALGVSRDVIIHDYLLTNVYKKEKNEESLAVLQKQYQDEDKVLAFRYLKEAQESFLLAALDTIDALYPTPLAYLQDVIKLTDKELKALKDLYLE